MMIDLLPYKDLFSDFFNFYLKYSFLYLFIANSSYVIILVLGYLNARKHYTKARVSFDRTKDLTSTLLPISMLVPAYNEELSIYESVRSMLRLHYPKFEVIVINDGSKDETVNVLIEKFNLERVDHSVPNRIATKTVRGVYKSKLFPTLTVIDKENGGKADALNCGINYSVCPLICCVDSDSLFDESGLIQMAIPFFEDQERVVAVGGVIRVANGCDIDKGYVKDIRVPWDYFAMIQIVEYLRAYLVGRMGWDYLNANIIISGAFGLFKKKAVVEVGGYSRETIGEDLDVLLKMHMHYRKNKIPYEVHFLPAPVCWTEVPTDLRTLGNQRSRWQQGLAEGLKRTIPMLGRPWAGFLGSVAIPYLWFFELLAAPIELVGYLLMIPGVYFGLIDPLFSTLFLLVTIVYGWILTFGAVIVEELTFRKYRRPSDYLKLCLATVLEQIGFRQLHLYWRLRGVWRFLRKKHSWGKMKRTGFSRAKT